MRCDLHVHSARSGAVDVRPFTRVANESYAEPLAVHELHLGVFDLTEAQHEAIAGRRHDAEALFTYLAEERIAACVNHPFSVLTGRRETEDLRRAFVNLSLVEAATA